MTKSRRVLAGFAILLTALTGCVLSLPHAFADPDPSASASPDPQASSSASADDDDQNGPPTKASPIPGSKLTKDEQEVRSDKRRLQLTQGEDKPVDLQFDIAAANAISVGNPKIVATTLVKIGDKRQIIFKPLESGETNVTIRDSNGDIKLIFQVSVTKSDLARISGELHELLRDIEGIDIRVVGSKVVIDGEIITPNDYGRLATVVGDSSYASFVLNLTQLSPQAMVAIAKRMQQDINSFAPNVTTRVVNGVIFLEGTVDNADQDRRAKDVSKVYLPDIRPSTLLENQRDVQKLTAKNLIQDFIVINPPPPKKQEKLVRVTIHFVELSKDYETLFAFKWQPGFSQDAQIAVGSNNTGGVGGSGGGFSATISSLFPKLASAQTAGYARVLRTGTVIVRSGQAAALEEGEQLPISAGAYAQQQPKPQDIGLKMGVTPTILGQSEDISLDVKLEQTDVVGKVTTGTAATTSKHHVETKIYVKSSESAAIAGVNSSDIGTDFNKDDPSPGTFGAQTDPLFTLLHSKDYHKKKSQFVIFVTPQIVENASEGTDDLKKNFRVKVK